MDVEIVTVGTELLLGFTIDGNTAEIGRRLARIGCNVVRSTSVPDDEAAIVNAVAAALEREGFVIVTGGLGPTRDDVTKKAVAEIFKAPLETDVEYLAMLQDRFAGYGKGPMPAPNRSQAEVPRGATKLTNAFGTAPGLWLDGGPGTVILLPGVPEEMHGILEAEVVPRLQQMLRVKQGTPSVTRSRTLRTTGVSESRLAEVLSSIESELAGMSLSFLPGLDGTDLRITVRDLAGNEADSTLDQAEQIILPLLGDWYYGGESTDLAAVVIQRLRDSQIRLATAESCTGGLVSARITSVPGASDVFAGGIICYENASKIRDLGVPEETLVQSGAVSEPVAVAMAQGVRARFQVDASIAVTGVAGPGGGTAEKPIGTVWLAASVGSDTVAVKRWFPGKRRAVQHRSAQCAIDLLRRSLCAV